MPVCLRGGILKITESLRSHPAMEISVYLLYVISPLHAENSEIIKKKNQITEIINSLASISVENAAGTEKAAHSVEDTSSSIMQIAEASNLLANLAEELQEQVLRFKI